MLRDLAKMFGSIFMIDLPSLLPVACLTPYSAGAGELVLTYATLGGVFGLILSVYLVRRRAHLKWSTRMDPPAAETASHIKNFCWAIFTCTF